MSETQYCRSCSKRLKQPSVARVCDACRVAMGPGDVAKVDALGEISDRLLLLTTQILKRIDEIPVAGPFPEVEDDSLPGDEWKHR